MVTHLESTAKIVYASRVTDHLDRVQPPGWPPPKGYANGMLGQGRILFVAGQIGWNPLDGSFSTDDPVAQFGQALDNVLAVVAAAGGRPQDVAQMTVFVTRIEEYRAETARLGAVWRERMGRHYPAMALVAVSALVEPRARVEIQATAIVPEVAP